MNNVLIRIIMLAVIGGLIGYLTNVVAIKLIFRPINPIKIPIFNIEIIGLIPKRKSEIAKNIGEVVQNEFLSMDEILENIITEEDKNNVVDYMKTKIKLIVNEKMSYMPTAVKSMVQGYISDMVESEVRKSIDELSEEAIIKAKTRINIQQMVETKINELDLNTLEDIIIQVAKKELKHIEILGLVLGFLIGIIQGIITIFI